jgi:hypothetical protein
MDLKKEPLEKKFLCATFEMPESKLKNPTGSRGG